MRVRIHGADSELRGVARLEDGRAVFVPGALPGETVEIAIEREAGRHAVARLLEVLEKSPDRVEPDCPHFAQCGGCAARHMRYGASLALKRQAVADALVRIGGAAAEAVMDIVPNARPLRNRNKAEFAVARGEIGFFAQGGSRFVPVSDCLLQREATVRAARAAAKLCPDARHVVARANRAGDMQITVANAGGKIDGHALLCETGAKGAHQCVITKPRPAHALDGRILHLAGDARLRETLFDLEFLLSPGAFFQTDAAQAELLYAKALQMAALGKGDRVLDAYCGAGTLTLLAAREAARCTGVEIVKSAVMDARENALRNGLADRAEFLLADAGEALSGALPYDALIVDPPRKGLDARFIQAIRAARPQRMAYVSCHPGTLARDVRLLEGAMELVSAVPVDMFPYTAHVEVVCSLAKPRAGHHIAGE